MSRHRTSKTTRPRLFSAGRVGAVLLVCAAIWLGSGFVSRLVLAYRLNTQVRALQAENSRIAQENKDYTQQLHSLSRPDGAEEQARQHNYVRPDEKVYIVTQPSPAPAVSGPAPAPKKAPEIPGPSFWGDFWSALSSHFP